MDSQFVYFCQNCTDCFMCANLHNQKYCFKNKQYSKEEYERILASYKLDTWSGVQKAQKEFQEFILTCPRRYAMMYQSPLSSGDLVSRCKNVRNSFMARKSENCSYCDFVAGGKDSYDITMSGELSECYESVVADHSQLNRFGLFFVKNQDIEYFTHFHNFKYSFGSVGLKNSNYCILNKQYSKEKYEELRKKIIEQMNSIPYKDKKGNIYKYGEYYPIELSYFGYNETCAPEEFPISKEEALSKGYNWQDNVQRTTGKETLLSENIPHSINDINDSILD